MATNAEKSKRIAKNTVVLYIRMIVVMIVALYTSRVILKALGVEDFGLYNVVGGVVTLFSFLRSSMEKATQRFLNVEMARGSTESLNKVFCVSLTIHLAIVLIVLILTETVGLWFLNSYIQIPAGREVAANWVYQATIVSLCFTILSVPYSAAIIAHESMSFYAVVSILDAFLKLAIAFLIMLDRGDRLIVYGLLMMGISVVNWFLYAFYCRRKYEETTYHFLFDRRLFREMFSFTGWTLLGQAAIIGTNQGNSILVNMYHSVTANAAMSIGAQVNGAVASLSSNFQTAFNPQITKSYAEGDFAYLEKLVLSTSKISYFLLFTVSLPIIFNIDTVLNLWLTVVPDYAGIFCILCLFGGILNALSAPLNFLVMSRGDIKFFQIATALVYLSDLVILVGLFSLGFPPYTAMAVKVFIMILVLYVRLHFATIEVKQLRKTFLIHVIVPVAIITVINILLGVLLFSNFSGIFAVIVNTSLLILSSLFSSYFILLQSEERKMLRKLIISYVHKKQ